MQSKSIQAVRVIVVGGGFGGRYAAQRLVQALPRGSEVTLIDRHDYMLYTPMLTEAAGRSVSPKSVQVPNRELSPRIKRVQEEVVGANLRERSVELKSGTVITADHLIIALGSVTNFHGVEGAEEHSLTMKSLEDARRVQALAQHNVLQASHEKDPARRKQLLSFVVAGGGYTGVEVAASLNDLIHYTAEELGVDEREIGLTLIEPGERLMSEMPESLASYTKTQLERDGVHVLTGTKVTKVTREQVTLSHDKSLFNSMLIWNTGIEPNPLVAALDCEKGAKGGMVTDSAFRVMKRPGVWAIGDCAQIPKPDGSGSFFEPTAQNATRQGTHLANNIVAFTYGRKVKPFRFKQVGSLAVIARHDGVAHVYGVSVKGLAGWLLWRAIYLAKMPSMVQRIGLIKDWLLLALGRKHVPVTWRLQEPSAAAHTIEA